MRLMQFLTENPDLLVSATLPDTEMGDINFEFCVREGEVESFVTVSVFGNEMAVSVGKEVEMQMFLKLEEQMGELENE